MTLTLEALPLPLHTDEHGAVRVGGTRVTLDTVIYAFWDGETPEQIAQDYSTLELADIYAVIAYYLRQRPDVDAYLCQREKQAADMRAYVESRHDSTGVRERLVARKMSQGS
jgi:uncharacterized protein (DUF433 family)